jgi:hypothetical protein
MGQDTPLHPALVAAAAVILVVFLGVMHSPQAMFDVLSLSHFGR